MFYSPAFPPRSCSPLYIPSFMFIYSYTLLAPHPQKKTQKTKSKSTNKNSKKNIKSTKSMDSVLCWSTLLGMRPALNYGWLYPAMLYHRKLIFHFLVGINYKHILFFFFREGSYVYFPFSMLGFCLVWACVGLVDADEICLSS